MKKSPTKATSKPSLATIILAVIASFFVCLALYAGYIWLIEQLNGGDAFSATGNETVVLMIVIMALIFGPSILAAVIIGIILKRRRK